MTIEEYDNKKPIRKTIDNIDNILNELNSVDESKEDCIKSIGVVVRYKYVSNPIDLTTTDSILIDRLKQLLLERKQELINEFEK